LPFVGITDLRLVGLAPGRRPTEGASRWHHRRPIPLHGSPGRRRGDPTSRGTTGLRSAPTGTGL